MNEYDGALREGALDGMTWATVKSSLLQTLPLLNCDLYVVFDGLDECEMSEEVYNLLCQCLSTPNTTVQIMMLGRPENPAIRKASASHVSITLEEALVKGDISSFITQEIEHLTLCGKLRVQSPTLKQEILNGLLKKAEGMFLWVRLQLDVLCSQTTDSEIRNALEVLPLGLENVYKQALSNISRQKPSFRALARKVILWVLFAKRLLMVNELLEGIAIAPGSDDINSENRLNDASLIDSVCAGMVSVGKGNWVETTHSSVRDFLLSIDTNLPVPLDFRHSAKLAHHEIATVCLSYLLFDQVKAHQLRSEEEARAFLGEHYFIVYASSHWAEHSRESNEDGLEDLIIQLLCSADKTYKWEYWAKVWQESSGRLHSLSHKPSQHSPLQIVIQEELLSTLKKLPDLESIVGEIDVDGFTPLLFAIVHDKVLAAIHLLDCGADPKTLGPKGRTSLHYAVRNAATTPLIPLLVAAGLDMHTVCDTNMSSFEYAAINGQLDALKALLKLEQDIKARISAASLALNIACSNDNLDIIEYLLSMNADVNHFDDLGWTSLHRAVHFKRKSTVRRLLQAGANPNARHRERMSPFEKAMDGGDFETIELLLHSGGDPLTTTSKQTTIVHWSVMSNDPWIVQWAMSQGIDVNHRNFEGDTPLMWASNSCSNVSVLKELLLKGALCHFHSSLDGTTALHRAAMRGFESGVGVLLDAVAHPEERDVHGFIALTWACQNGHSDVVDKILATESDINIADNNGETPLIKAVSFGHVDIVEKLTGARADVHPFKDGGYSALHVALTKRNTVIVKLLLDAGASISVVSSNGITPLMIASWKQSDVLLDLILGQAPSLNDQDKEGFSALSFAASHGRTNNVRRLVEAGALVNIRSRSGKPPPKMVTHSIRYRIDCRRHNTSHGSCRIRTG